MLEVRELGMQVPGIATLRSNPSADASWACPMYIYSIQDLLSYAQAPSHLAQLVQVGLVGIILVIGHSRAAPAPACGLARVWHREVGQPVTVLLGAPCLPGAQSCLAG